MLADHRLHDFDTDKPVANRIAMYTSIGNGLSSYFFLTVGLFFFLVYVQTLRSMDSLALISYRTHRFSLYLKEMMNLF